MVYKKEGPTKGLVGLAHTNTHRKHKNYIMSILSQIDSSLFSEVAENPDTFKNTSTSTMLVAGKQVPYAASINGVKIPAYVTLESASLTRMSVIEQTAVSTGEMYHLVTGIFKPVKMNVEVVVDGQTIDLVDLFLTLARQGTPGIDRETFSHQLTQMGLNLTGGMPLLWQQFGASTEGIQHAVREFAARGAEDVISEMKNPGRIVAAYQHPGDGVPVTSFEIGTVDRTKSSRYAFDGVGQGFLNLVEAQYEQFVRIAGLRKSVDVLTSELNANTGTWEESKVREVNDRIQTLGKMASQWQSNWAGAQQRIRTLESGGFIREDIYDAVNAPCGRFVMDGVEVDLWSNSSRANTSTKSETVASKQFTLSSAADDEEDNF